jgi:PAS domain S-box-containing protein
LAKLVHNVVVSLIVSILALSAALIYLIFALRAAHAAGTDVLLYAILAIGLTAAACGALAPLMRRNRLLHEDVKRLEERIEDLTDRQWELRESEERARSLIEMQGDLIVRRDGEGRITFANDMFCALAGRPYDDLLGSPFRLDVLEQGDVTVLSDGTRMHDQKMAVVDGERWIAWREVIVRTEDGNEIQWVGRDVTGRVLAEHALAEARDQADAANRAKSRFLAMVSHEIRTPLSGILGMADLLLDTPLTPEQTTYAKAVKSSGETLLSLIEEILDFSKVEAGKLDLDARPFALGLLVEEAVELLAPRAQAKGIEIAAFIDEKLPEHVMGDAARLRQVLLNLAGNAVKFTEKGGVSVVVEPGAEPDAVTFTVGDTGIGISDDARARIFEEFEQADGGAARKYGGTGLGLSISKRIVERMGGAIALDSALNAGSTFRFTIDLPAHPGAEATPAPPASPALANTEVLIVAPNGVEAALVARRLGSWGARTCVVGDAKVALAILPERPWDTIIVDRAVGQAEAEAIVRACARTTARRLVLVTPGERHELPGLVSAGFTGYLVKPVRAASLAARFRTEPADPAGDNHADEAAPLPAAAAERGRAVLVAEDNEINALLARALLTKLGHRPTVAVTGTDAIDSWLAAHAAGEPYDIVLMDVHMPEMDGLEAARRIRAIEQERGLARTPVIALTANASAEDREACLEAGMDGFLTKPLNRDELTETLATGGRSASLAA